MSAPDFLGDASQVLRRLRNGKRAKPFVLDDGEFRNLYFGSRYTQSSMHIRSPNELALAYTRKMMGFLLFNPDPRDIAIIGLGGGSLTKFCHRHLLRARLVTIEIDQSVVDLAPVFAVPPPDRRHQIVWGDAADYFKALGENFDVVMVDGCDQYGIAPALSDERFFKGVRRRLLPGGVVVVNLVGTMGRSAELIETIATTFDQVVTLDVSIGGNVIVYALHEPARLLSEAERAKRADCLTRTYGIDFRGMCGRLRWLHRAASGVRARTTVERPVDASPER
jgi:spermidine synthase